MDHSPAANVESSLFNYRFLVSLYYTLATSTHIFCPHRFNHIPLGRLVLLSTLTTQLIVSGHEIVKLYLKFLVW